MNLIYTSSQGEVFDLISKTGLIRLRSANFHDYSWKYEGTAKQFGIRLNRFTKSPYEYAAKLEFKGEIDDRRVELNRFHDAIEYDLLMKKSGKLQWGDYYLHCFIISTSTYPDDASHKTLNDIVVFAPHPFWIKEVSCNFEINQKEYEDGVDYLYDYEFDYAPSGISYVKWDTRHNVPSDFKLYVYGPCINPMVSINGYPYQVYTTLGENEYFVLDSKEHTITKYLANGTTSNLYNSRQFTPTVFAKIPGNIIDVAWNGDFRFVITMYQERSEPRWYERNTVYMLAADGSYLITEGGAYIILQRKE